MFFTEAEIAFEEIVTLSFISDDGTCDISIEIYLSILNIRQPVDSSECGICSLVATPDYSTLQCPNFNLEIDLEGAVGTTWISRNNTL